MLAGLQWDSLMQRRKVARLSMFYKMQSGLVATDPSLFLIQRPDTTVPRYNIPHSRIDAHLYSFFPNTVRAWNHLPATTVLAPSLAAFKARVTI
jgi:hypothetical protein